MPSSLGIVASGVSFRPDSLNPELWLDAADISTITSSGGAVSQWNDKSRNGRNVTQSTAAAQPGTGAVTQNGRNVLTFDGGDVLVAATASDWTFLNNDTNYIVAVVVRLGNIANPDAIYRIIGTSAATSGSVGFELNWLDDSVNERNERLQHAVQRGVLFNSAVSNVSSDGFAAANTFLVITVLADPDNATASARSTLQVNSNTALTANTLTNAPSASAPASALNIGALNAGSSQPLVGRIGEIVIVSGTNATEANRVALRDYLNTKWAVY